MDISNLKYKVLQFIRHTYVIILNCLGLKFSWLAKFLFCDKNF